MEIQVAKKEQTHTNTCKHVRAEVIKNVRKLGPDPNLFIRVQGLGCWV